MIEGVLAKSGPIKLFARIVFECLSGNTSLILQVQVQGDGLLHVPGCTSTTSCSRSAWAYSSSGESDGSGLALSPRNPECDHHSPPPSHTPTHKPQNDRVRQRRLKGACRGSTARTWRPLAAASAENHPKFIPGIQPRAQAASLLEFEL